MATRGDIAHFENISIVYAGVCTCSGRPVVVPVKDKTYASVEVKNRSATAWATAVVEVRVGNSASGPFYPLASTVTFSASGISGVIDVRGYGFLALEVTTAGASGMTIDADICVKDTSQA